MKMIALSGAKVTNYWLLKTYPQDALHKVCRATLQRCKPLLVF